MLIHRFEAEPQGFQELFDDKRGKPMSPKNTFSERNVFLKGVPALRAIQNEGNRYSNADQETIFVFDVPCGLPKSSNFC